MVATLRRRPGAGCPDIRRGGAEYLARISDTAVEGRGSVQGHLAVAAPSGRDAARRHDEPGDRQTCRATMAGSRRSTA